MYRGQKRFEYPDVVVVALLDFPVGQPRPVHRVELRRDDGALWSEKLSFVIVSLGNFGKALTELETPEDEWLYLLKNLETMTEVPTRYKANKEFTELMDNAEWAKLSPRDRDRYDKFYLDYTKRISEQKSEVQQIIAMVVKGATERLPDALATESSDLILEKATDGIRASVAERMRDTGDPINEIAHVVGLPEGRVRQIIAEASHENLQKPSSPES